MKFLTSILSFISLCAVVIQAQISKPPAQKEPATKMTRSEAEAEILDPQKIRSLSLLNSLLKETNEFDDRPLRIKVQANIADSLWDRQPARAREIFIDAFQAIDAIEFPKPQNSSEASNPSRSRLRQSVLKVIAMRDAELAEKLRKTIEENEKKSEVDPQKVEKEQNRQALVLAASLAKSEPDKAARLLRQVLNNGGDSMEVMVLNEMRQSHPEWAKTLFLECLEVERKKAGPVSESLGMLYAYFASEMDRLNGRNSLEDPARSAVIRPFLSAVLEVVSRHVAVESEGIPAIDNKQAFADSIVLQEMIPLFTQILPDALPTIRLRISQLAKYVPSAQSEAFSKGMSMDSEATLKEAETAIDPKQKDILYARAASQAVLQGKYDEALRIVDKIRDRTAREMSASIVRYQIALRAVNKDELNEALRYAREIEFSPQRVAIYKMCAEKMIGKKDRQQASEVLSEIERWLESSIDDPKKVLGLLNIAGVVASFDPPHGFEVAKLAVKAINNTEFKPPANKSEVTITIELLDFSASFTPLARSDFDRALLIAQEIRKKEASVIAQVEVCKAALVGAPSKKM